MNLISRVSIRRGAVCRLVDSPFFSCLRRRRQSRLLLRSSILAALTLLAALCGARASSVKVLNNVASWSTAGIPLALSNELVNIIDVQATRTGCLVLRADGKVFAWGDANNNIPFVVPNTENSGVIGIAGGAYHALAVRSDGTVAAWGDPAHAAVPPGLSDIVAVGAGHQGFSFALRNDGLLHFWQTANGVVTYPNQSVLDYLATARLAQIEGTSSGGVGITTSGEAVEITTSGVNALHPGPFVKVSGQSGLKYGLKADGTVVELSDAWKDQADYVPLPPGLGGVTDLDTGVTWAALRRSDGTIKLWGRGGNNTWASISQIPPQVSNNVVKVSAWEANIAALLGNPVVAQSPQITVQPQGATANSGATVTMSVTATGTAPLSYQWIKNSVVLKGQTSATLTLSNVSLDDVGQYRVHVAGAGTAALSTPAQLNVNPFPLPRPTRPPAFPFATKVLVNGQQIVETAPPSAAALNDAVMVGVGSHHGAALRADGTVVSWGNPVDGSNVDISTYQPADLTDVVSIACGKHHVLALKSDGTVVRWGKTDSTVHPGSYVPPDLTNVVAVAGGFNKSIALRADGTVYLWHENNDSEAKWGLVPGATNIVKITSGSNVGIGLTANNELVEFGVNGVKTNSVDSAFTRGLLRKISAQMTDVLSPLTSDYHHGNNNGTFGVLRTDGTLAFNPSDIASWPGTFNNAPIYYRSGNLDGNGVIAPINASMAALTGVVDVDAGSSALLALRSDGTLHGIGQLGANSKECEFPAEASNNVVGFSIYERSTAILIGVNTPVVAESPQIFVQPQSVLADLGSTVTMSVIASGTGPLSFQWKKGNAALPGQNSPTLTLSNMKLSDVGEYTVVVSGAGTPAVSAKANLTSTDSDGDGIKDTDETSIYGTDPNKADTDGDGFGDGAEVTYGSNPLVASSPVSMEFVKVGDAGNAADPFTNLGAVGYEYRIGKYEVTVGEYVEFLNAVAASDPQGLYSTIPGLPGYDARIRRTGVQGAYRYNVIEIPENAREPGFSDATRRPVSRITWSDAARYVNWLANGKPSGPQNSATTENGAYDLNRVGYGIAPARNAINPNTGQPPSFWIPTANEWYKAAYYKGGGTAAGYWRYPTKSDIEPGNTIGNAPNQANHYRSGQFGFGKLAEAGSFTGSAGVYGTFDLGGNVPEWNDLDGATGSDRGIMGASWLDTILNSGSYMGLVPVSECIYYGSFTYATAPGTAGQGGIGFRVAGSAAVLALPAAKFSLPELVTVGDAGNTADANGRGAVAFDYRIGKYEVTIAQYAAFLNTVASVVASSDTHLVTLWDARMASDPNVAGISRTGSGTAADPYIYQVIGNANRPITYISWFDAARFCNWLHHGAAVDASTEYGAYALNGATDGLIERSIGAKWFIPTQDEWYKAAYYKGGGTGASYWSFPTGSDTPPGNTVGNGSNQANYFDGDYALTQSAGYSATQNYLTTVGAFSGSAGTYGTFDQAGNVCEWTDGGTTPNQPIAGGAWRLGSGFLLGSASASAVAVDGHYHVNGTGDIPMGFRVGAEAPPPARPAMPPEMVEVGDRSNFADWNFYPAGSVAYGYRIGKFEVTIAQYVAFLNSVAAVMPTWFPDGYPNGAGHLESLWHPSMASDLNVAGISRTGAGTEENPYVYAPIGSGQRPIAYVSWFDAARFCNWMHNGARTDAWAWSSTETGAYALNGAVSGTAPARNAAAKWWIPNADEWHKAAYFNSPLNGGLGNWFFYPTRSYNQPGNSPGDEPNQANYADAYYAITGSATLDANINYLTEVGTFVNSASAYGTFDQAGNLREWVDGTDNSPSLSRGVRGSSWGTGADRSDLQFESYSAGTHSPFFGFRLAAAPVVDTDGDGLTDEYETLTGVYVSGTDTGSDSGNPDTDGDGLNDGAEVAAGTDPNVMNDTDGDGLPDLYETKTGVFVSPKNAGTDPTKADTDGDGQSDGYEVQEGSNPTDPSSVAVPKINVETVLVGDAGNTADTTGFGAVQDPYRIGKFEVTVAQYTAFLNSAAKLASAVSDSLLSNPDYTGVSRSGSGTALEPYTYNFTGNGNRPIREITWFNAARLANWLHNGGRDSSGTETGAYTLNGMTWGDAAARNPGAKWWIPTENEWYKAAYYKGGGLNAGYWRYPTRSDTAPTPQATPPGTPNSANFGAGGSYANGLTPVGAYTTSHGPYGTFDQAGNVQEWNDLDGTAGSLRGLRGGEFMGTGDPAKQPDGSVATQTSTGYTFNVGVRLATKPTATIPEGIAVSGAVNTTYGTASSTATFTVSGTELPGDLTVTPPAGFEVSTNMNSGFAATVTLTPSGGTVPSTTIYLRLAAATSAGTYSGDILVSTPGAPARKVATFASIVSKKELTVTGLSATGRVYNGTTSVVVSGTAAFSGLVLGQSFDASTNAVSWAFTDKAVGTNRPLFLSGSYAAPSPNYIVTQPTLQATITAKSLTVTGAVAANKVVDGTTAATISGATLSGVIPGDTVNLTGANTGTFASTAVGNNIPVNTSMGLSGADSANYTLQQPTLTANISAPASGWNESANGPLSSAAASPTQIALSAGVNSIVATVGGNVDDHFTFTVPQGSKLVSFVHHSYNSTDSVAWLGLQNGSPWTAGDDGSINAQLLRAHTHFGAATVGQALLGITSNSPLLPGTYTVKVQQFGANSSYRFDLTLQADVTPNPTPSPSPTPPPSATPKIMSMSHHPSNGFSMSWSPAGTVDVQRSTTLSGGTWSTLTNNSTNGTFIDTNTPRERAFYRLIIR